MKKSASPVVSRTLSKTLAAAMAVALIVALTGGLSSGVIAARADDELIPPPPTAPLDGAISPPSPEPEAPPASDGVPAPDAPAAVDAPPAAEIEPEKTETVEESPAETPPPSDETLATEGSPTSDESSQQSRELGRPLKYPRYQFERPAWAMHLQGALDAFGSNASVSGLHASEKIRAAQLLVEWQPKFIQAFGVLGLGLTLSDYPLVPAASLTSGPLGIWSVGAQARYQLRYFREQWVVPYAGIGQEWVKYALKRGDSPAGSFFASDVFFGGMLLLNMFEPAAAADAYASTGMLRTYLTFEYRSRSGGADGSLALNSSSYYGGLRFEF